MPSTSSNVVIRLGVLMTTEECAHFEVLLENIQRSLNVIVELRASLIERVDRMASRVDRIEAKVDSNGTTLGGVEVFASDAQRRLQRIETHLPLNGSSHSRPPRKATRAASPKRRKQP
jgi:hypothetical protein